MFGAEFLKKLQHKLYIVSTIVLANACYFQTLQSFLQLKYFLNYIYMIVLFLKTLKILYI